VASFTDRSKADALLNQVKNLGYSPMIETAVTSGKQYYRVRLKPTSDRPYLERASGELDKALRVTTQILTYQP
jgi:cell division septation protein DedD